MRSFTQLLLAWIFLITMTGWCAAQTRLDATEIYISSATDTTHFTLTCYSPEVGFSPGDEFLFSRDYSALQVVGVELVHQHRMTVTLRLTPSLDLFGKRDYVIKDTTGSTRATGSFVLRGPRPSIRRVATQSEEGNVLRDTLRLADYGATYASLIVLGSGFNRDTRVSFDDPTLQVSRSPDEIYVSPDSMVLRLVVREGRAPTVGPIRFHLDSPFTAEAVGSLVIRSARGPRIRAIQPEKIVSDGSVKSLRITGDGLFSNSTVEMIGPEGSIVSVEQVEMQHGSLVADVAFPVWKEPKNYKLVVRNRDGQAASKNLFTLPPRTVYSATGKARDGKPLFFGHSSPLIFNVEGQDLVDHRDYEITIRNQKYSGEIRDRRTLLAGNVVLEAPEGISSYLEQDSVEFHIRAVDSPNGRPAAGLEPRWAGRLELHLPPRNIATKPDRLVLRPGEEITATIQGSNLRGVRIVDLPPDVTFENIRSGDDFLTFKGKAAKKIVRQFHNIVLEKRGRRFTTGRGLEIKAWQDPRKFIWVLAHHTGLWRPLKSNGRQETTSNRVITLRVDGARLQDPQTLKLTLDSVDPVNYRKVRIYDELLEVPPGDGDGSQREHAIFHGHRVKPGQTLLLRVSTPDGRRVAQETFVVKRRFAEKFKPTTAVSLVQVPLTRKDKTEYLRSIGFGVNWMPWEDDILTFDGYLFVANPTSADNSLEVKFRLGALAVLWNNFKLGFATDLTGNPLEDWYFIVGSGIRFPVPGQGQ